MAPGREGPSGLSAEDIQKLPVIKIEQKHCQWSDETNELEAPTCAICVDTIRLMSLGMFMPCGHVYHPHCLKTWLAKRNICPLCRAQLKT